MLLMGASIKSGEHDEFSYWQDTEQMNPSFRTALVVTTSWCLLFVCLCLVSVALMERLNLLPEMNSQDEEALSEIAQILKTKTQSNKSCESSSAAAVASALSCLAAPDTLLLAHDATSLRLPALSLFQRLSVYRI
jgi:p-aminobenzoyl-glutamate transporter AbgT